MNRKTIDQTASELQLHRVFYLITFLRAMVLHVTLLLLAALLYFLTGIDNAYPVGTAASYKLSGRRQSHIAFKTRFDRVYEVPHTARVRSLRSSGALGLDVSFNYKCPAVRTACSSRFDASHHAFEHSRILAKPAICFPAFESFCLRFSPRWVWQ